MQYVNKGLELVIVYTCLLKPHAMRIYEVPSSIELATQLSKLIKEYSGVCVCSFQHTKELLLSPASISSCKCRSV